MSAVEVVMAALEDIDGVHIRLRVEGRHPSHREVLESWQQDFALLDPVLAELRRQPWRGIAWEMPALTEDSIDADFECVAIRADYLDVVANEQDFSVHLAEGAEVVDFPNLGGDAQLVVPGNTHPGVNYAHLLGFLRSAPKTQQRQLFARAALLLEGMLSQVPIWLSTAGGGVDWLHLRLDQRPKYYRYAPYRI